MAGHSKSARSYLMIGGSDFGSLNDAYPENHNVELEVRNEPDSGRAADIAKSTRMTRADISEKISLPRTSLKASAPFKSDIL